MSECESNACLHKQPWDQERAMMNGEEREKERSVYVPVVGVALPSCNAVTRTARHCAVLCCAVLSVYV